ncbi:MAG: hypothetical protein ACRC7P_10185, partial [Enterovibrio sp.]
ARGVTFSGEHEITVLEQQPADVVMERALTRKREREISQVLTPYLRESKRFGKLTILPFRGKTLRDHPEARIEERPFTWPHQTKGRDKPYHHRHKVKHFSWTRKKIVLLTHEQVQEAKLSEEAKETEKMRAQALAQEAILATVDQYIGLQGDIREDEGAVLAMVESKLGELYPETAIQAPQTDTQGEEDVNAKLEQGNGHQYTAATAQNEGATVSPQNVKDAHNSTPQSADTDPNAQKDKGIKDKKNKKQQESAAPQENTSTSVANNDGATAQSSSFTKKLFAHPKFIAPNGKESLGVGGFIRFSLGVHRRPVEHHPQRLYGGEEKFTLMSEQGRLDLQRLVQKRDQLMEQIKAGKTAAEILRTEKEQAKVAIKQLLQQRQESERLTLRVQQLMHPPSTLQQLALDQIVMQPSSHLQQAMQALILQQQRQQRDMQQLLASRPQANSKRVQRELMQRQEILRQEIQQQSLHLKQVLQEVARQQQRQQRDMQQLSASHQHAAPDLLQDLAQRQKILRQDVSQLPMAHKTSDEQKPAKLQHVVMKQLQVSLLQQQIAQIGAQARKNLPQTLASKSSSLRKSSGSLGAATKISPQIIVEAEVQHSFSGEKPQLHTVDPAVVIPKMSVAKAATQTALAEGDRIVFQGTHDVDFMGKKRNKTLLTHDLSSVLPEKLVSEPVRGVAGPAKISGINIETKEEVVLCLPRSRRVEVYLPGPQDMHLIEERIKALSVPSDGFYIVKYPDPDAQKDEDFELVLAEKSLLKNNQLKVTHLGHRHRDPVPKHERNPKIKGKQYYEKVLSMKEYRERRNDPNSTTFYKLTAFSAKTGAKRKLLLNIGIPLTVHPADSRLVPAVSDYCRQYGGGESDLVMMQVQPEGQSDKQELVLLTRSQLSCYGFRYRERPMQSPDPTPRQVKLHVLTAQGKKEKIKLSTAELYQAR